MWKPPIYIYGAKIYEMGLSILQGVCVCGGVVIFIT